MPDIKLPRIKYASDIRPSDWLYIPQHGFPLDIDKVKSPENRCYLIAISEDQINLAMNFIKLAHRYLLWGFPNSREWDSQQFASWDQIEELISETEHAFMSGCDIEQVIKALVSIRGAILGENLDLSDPLLYLPDNLDFTSGGLYPGLVPTLTNLDANLGGVLGNIALDPIVNVNCSCGGSGCSSCCPGGSEPTSEPGDQGGDPPVGWDEPTGDDGQPVQPGSPSYNVRKCKVANLIHDRTVRQVQALKLAGIDDWGAMLAASGLSAFSAWVYSVLATAAAPFSFVLSGIGVMFVIVEALVDNAFDLDNLLILMDQNEEDLVCSLYNSNEPITARDDYAQVLTDAGAGAGQIILLKSILLIDTLNALYFNPDAYLGALQAALVNYNPPIPCDCNCEHFISGTLVSDNGTQVVIAALEWAGGYRVQIGFFDGCNPVSLNGYMVTSGVLSDHPSTVHNWRIYSPENPPTPGSNGDIYSDDNPPSGFPYGNVYYVAINSGDQFTIQLDYLEEV